MESTKLIVFLVFVLLFFYVSFPDLNRYPDEGIPGATLKILPILTLIFTVIGTQAQDPRHSYQLRYFTYGLLTSSIGDVLMHWRHEFLLPALCTFGVAHGLYILAFRLKPFGYEAASFCFTSGAVSFMFLLPGIKGRVLQTAVLLYGILVMATWWRAIVQWQQSPSLVNLLGAGGGLMFALSDFIIGLDTWKFPGRIPYAPCLIMVTYYLAQLLLSVPVINYGWTFTQPDDGRDKKKE